MDDPEKEQMRRFLCFLGRSQNISPNTIMREVKILKVNSFILVKFIYVLYIEEYVSL